MRPVVPRGFTLIELTIVMVIVGALMAGLYLGGGAVLDSAKTSTLISLIRDLAAASRSFKERYGYFPGDLPNAAQRIPDIALGSTCDYAPDATSTNGLVDRNLESTCAMEHLVKARLLTKVQRKPDGVTFFLPSPVGDEVSLWFEGTENVVRVTGVPCAIALEIDAKLDNASATPFATGLVRASTPTCVPGPDFDTSEAHFSLTPRNGAGFRPVMRKKHRYTDF